MVSSVRPLTLNFGEIGKNGDFWFGSEWLAVCHINNYTCNTYNFDGFFKLVTWPKIANYQIKKAFATNVLPCV